MHKKLLFIAASLSISLMACKSHEEEKIENNDFTCTQPLLTDTTVNQDYVAQIHSVREIEIRAQEKGFLQGIFVDEGQFVKKGQLLFKIMPGLYEAELLSAKAEAKAAEIEFQNTKVLSDKNIVSPNELALQQAKWDKAKAEVALAELHLSFTEIRAPFDGTIDRIPEKLGSLIEEGALLTKLSDNSEVFAYFNFSEPEYLHYKRNESSNQNRKVELLLADNQLLDAAGKIEVVESEFENETGNIAIRARFPNPKSLLKNGETGKVRYKAPYKNVLLIPQKACFEIQDKKFVFVLDKENKVRSREIVATAEIPDLYIVKEGLSKEERFVVDGVQKLKEGNQIKAEVISPLAIIEHLKLKAE